MKNAFISIAALAALFLSAFTAIADEPELVEVIAIGAGMTQDEAHKAADKAAVEQVVGTIIDATTLVKNDELVEEKILTYSAALIADSKIIGTPKKGANGLITLKVKATVKKTALKEKLTAAKLVSVAIDGESLWAQAVSAQDNLADAEAMIKDVLAKHIACVVAEPIPGKTGKSPLDYDPKTGEVFANVRVRIDQTKYTQFVKEVLGKLGPMAEQKVKLMSQGQREDYLADGYFYYKFQKPVKENWLCIMTSFKTGAATFLWFDKNRTATIRNCLDAGPLAISAVLYDTTGTEIAERQVPLGRDSNCSIFCSLTGCMAIVPLFGGECYHTIENDCIGAEPYDCPKTEDIFHVSLGKFSAEELKSIGHLKIKVGHMKNGQFTEE